MNKQEFINTVKNMEPPKYFSALTFKEAYNEGFESAKNEVLFISCFLDVKEPIDLINSQNLNFNLGNVVKYVYRAGKKNGENKLSDLEKAKDYINYEIERVKQ